MSVSASPIEGREILQCMDVSPRGPQRSAADVTDWRDQGPMNAARSGRWRVRCVAPNRTNGERCKRWANRGACVCAKHGGKLPNVVKSANRRFEHLQDASFELFDFAMQPACVQATRMKAAKNVLRMTRYNEVYQSIGDTRYERAAADAVDTFIDSLVGFDDDKK